MRFTASHRFLFAGSLLLAAGCAPSVDHSFGFPRIAVHDANWKQVSLAITEYNLSKGRKLDLVRPNELVLYDAKPSPDGSEQITGKTIYDYTFLPDSVIITSHHYQTSDLDDTNVAEASDSATYISEQQELTEIAKEIGEPSSDGGIASPVPSR